MLDLVCSMPWAYVNGLRKVASSEMYSCSLNKSRWRFLKSPLLLQKFLIFEKKKSSSSLFILHKEIEEFERSVCTRNQHLTFLCDFLVLERLT